MPRSDTAKKWITILALIFFGHASGQCIAIRYGFLADAFAKKNVPGRVYGLVGATIAAGYVVMFITQLAERAMREWNSKVVMASNAIGFAMVALITGFTYNIPNTAAIIVISIVMRIGQGLLAYTCNVVTVDFINAQFPEEFDMINGLLNVGYFSSYGMAEVIGSIIYDHFSYEAAYTYSAVIALMAAAGVYFFIPNCKTYLSTQEELPDEDLITEGEALKSETSKITRLLILPLVAQMLINTSYGVLQVYSC